jgi:hypothetical protein
MTRRLYCRYISSVATRPQLYTDGLQYMENSLRIFLYSLEHIHRHPDSRLCCNSFTQNFLLIRIKTGQLSGIAEENLFELAAYHRTHLSSCMLQQRLLSATEQE